VCVCVCVCVFVCLCVCACVCVVNLLGYRQTKLLIALRYSLFWTNLMAQEVELEVDNVDSN